MNLSRRQFLGSTLLLPLSGRALLGAEPKAAREIFVAVGYGGRRLVSADGKDWTIAAEWAENGGDDGNNLMGLTFGKGMFVATGGGGAGKNGKAGGHILISKDGKDWKEVYSAKFRISPVLFGNDRFVAGGPSHNMIYSLDAETWKEGAKLTAKEASHYRQGAFGNNVFVFIGNNGGNSPLTWVATTKDGEKLEHIAIDLPPVRGLAFGPGRFVAVGPNGLRMSSKDGTIWGKDEPIEGEDFTWVVWSGSQFLCGGKAIYASADGVKWEKFTDRIPCQIKWTDGVRGIGSTWPGQMWYSADLKTWAKCKTLTPNGINKVTMASLDAK